jgi:hypothetical protein
LPAANNNHLPAIYPYRYYAADGGLVSYGPDYGRSVPTRSQLYRSHPQRGAVQGPTKYELTLVPKQHTTGGKDRLGSITSRAIDIFDCHCDFAMRRDGCHQSSRLSGFSISLLRPSVVSSASAAPD